MKHDTSEINEFTNALENEFKNNANEKIAQSQKAYMRNKFEFYGIKTTERRAIQAPFMIKAYLPSKTDAEYLIRTLWLKPQRDYQLFSQELAFKYIKQIEEKDIKLFEFMVAHKSWWDTVDFIAYKLIGEYFKVFPQQRDRYIKKWLNSGNIWLQRSALLFQLKYKNDLDTNCLSNVINALLGSNEFFINKAIGWVLREHSRTDPDWVMTFVNQTTLAPLSEKEALRLINN